MAPMTLPAYVLPEGLSQPEIDMDALRRAAAPDDNSPVIVSRRYLKQVERELTAGREAQAVISLLHRQAQIDAALFGPGDGSGGIRIEQMQ
jgi:hypothetical protein